MRFRRPFKGTRPSDVQNTELLTTDMAYNPGTHPRELNPYWKNGGTGLPSNESQNLTSEKIEGRASFLKNACHRVMERPDKEKGSNVAGKKRASLGNLDFHEANKRIQSKFRFDEELRISEHSKNPLVCEKTDEKYKVNVMKHKTKNDNSAGSKKYNEMFQRPSDESYFPTTCHSTTKFRDKPSWMKKEYCNQTGQSTSKEMQSPLDVQQRSLPEDEAKLFLSDEEMNVLGAKMLKAELLGDNETAAILKVQLETARHAKETTGQQSKAGQNREDIVILTQTNSKGFCRPLLEPQNTVSRSGRKKRKASSKSLWYP